MGMTNTQNPEAPAHYSLVNVDDDGGTYVAHRWHTTEEKARTYAARLGHDFDSFLVDGTGRTIARYPFEQ